jgi:hypothetical protein
MNFIAKALRNLQIEFYSVDISGRLRKQTEKETGVKMTDEEYFKIYKDIKYKIKKQYADSLHN